MTRCRLFSGVVLLIAASLLVGLAGYLILKAPERQANVTMRVPERSFIMTSKQYGSRFGSLPESQQRLLHVKYGTTRLTSKVPIGGEQLFDPGSGASADSYASPLILQPSSPSASDISAAQADSTALAAYGPAVTNTVSGLGTLVTELPSAGQSVAPGAVVDLPVWVVTITPATPISAPTCGIAGSTCPTSTLANWIVIINASTGQVDLAFDQ